MRTEYKFCPRCGGSLTVAHPNGDIEEPEQPICQACGFIFWQNSKPCAGVLVVRDGHLLLVKRAFAPYKGWWDIPGGFLKEGEHPEAGARRELLEETGLDIRLTGMVGIIMDTYGGTGDATLNVFYTGEITGGLELAGSDAVVLRWFPAQAIPRNVAFACNREAIRLWKAGLKPERG
jgi:ADP-ribose pyrophosphatase YjhB (NUDIX family)